MARNELDVPAQPIAALGSRVDEPILLETRVVKGNHLEVVRDDDAVVAECFVEQPRALACCRSDHVVNATTPRPTTRNPQTLRQQKK